MRLKTQVIQLIMQFPGIFPNALCVYNHLFYIIGNGFIWSNGELREKGFRRKSERKCIQEMIQFHNEARGAAIKSLVKWKEEGKLSAEVADKVILRNKSSLLESIEKETYIVKHAVELSEDFTVPENFTFYPIYKGYSRCTTIPNDIKPDWLEGINFINQLREKLIKENPSLDLRRNDK